MPGTNVRHGQRIIVKDCGLVHGTTGAGSNPIDLTAPGGREFTDCTFAGTTGTYRLDSNGVNSEWVLHLTGAIDAWYRIN
jgi:hypothetical protein